MIPQRSRANVDTRAAAEIFKLRSLSGKDVSHQPCLHKAVATALARRRHGRRGEDPTGLSAFHAPFYTDRRKGTSLRASDVQLLRGAFTLHLIGVACSLEQGGSGVNAHAEERIWFATQIAPIVVARLPAQLIRRDVER